MKADSDLEASVLPADQVSCPLVGTQDLAEKEGQRLTLRATDIGASFVCYSNKISHGTLTSK